MFALLPIVVALPWLGAYAVRRKRQAPAPKTTRDAPAEGATRSAAAAQAAPPPSILPGAPTPAAPPSLSLPRPAPKPAPLTPATFRPAVVPEKVLHTLHTFAPAAAKVLAATALPNHPIARLVAGGAATLFTGGFKRS